MSDLDDLEEIADQNKMQGQNKRHFFNRGGGKHFLGLSQTKRAKIKKAQTQYFQAKAKKIAQD